MAGVILSELLHVLQRWRKHYQYRTQAHELNEKLSRLKALEPFPKVVQKGPFNRFPEEGEIIAKVVSSREKPLKKIEEIIRKYGPKWEAEGLTNGEVFGVVGIRLPREKISEAPRVLLELKPFGYYEFLATLANLKLRQDLTEAERNWVAEQVKPFTTPLRPLPNMPHNLSVEVLLLYNNKNKMVLMKRSSKTAYRHDLIAPSASEGVTPEKDAKGIYVDLVEVCKRALEEEQGMQREGLEDVYLTSVILDPDYFAYEVTAVATTELDEEAIRENFQIGRARDKYESDVQMFYDFPLPHSDLKSLLDSMSHQAKAAYVMAMADLHGWDGLYASLE